MNMIFKTLLRDFFQFLIQIYSLRSHKFLTLLAQIQQLTMVFVAHHMEVFSRDLCIDNHANIAIQIRGGGGQSDDALWICFILFEQQNYMLYVYSRSQLYWCKLKCIYIAYLYIFYLKLTVQYRYVHKRVLFYS